MLLLLCLEWGICVCCVGWLRAAPRRDGCPSLGFRRIGVRASVGPLFVTVLLSFCQFFMRCVHRHCCCLLAAAILSFLSLCYSCAVSIDAACCSTFIIFVCSCGVSIDASQTNRAAATVQEPRFTPHKLMNSQSSQIKNS